MRNSRNSFIAAKPLTALIGAALIGTGLLGACAPAEDTAQTDSGSDPQPADGAGSGDGSDAVGEVVDEITQAGPDNIPVDGTAWLSVGDDGAVQTTFIDADGRYRDMRNGELFGEGSWQKHPDGRLCFEPDSGAGACWALEQTDTDGAISATNGNDRKIELKRVAYTPPADADEGEGG